MNEEIDQLDIIYEDSDLIAINKPHGLLVHRTPIAKDAKFFAVQILRDQIGQKVYPVHRLDRKTSGVLLFAKNQEANKAVQELFRNQKIHKTYIAITRGHIPDQGIIDYAITHEGKTQDAVTHYRCLGRYITNIPTQKYETSRYSLVELKPEHGRFHQLRKHMAHIMHPILGDRPHGCNKLNKVWKEKFQMTSMMLHATELKLNYRDDIIIHCQPRKEFVQTLEIIKKNSIDITTL